MENAKDKVLIIDDSQLNINIITDILKSDYEILSAHSAMEGLHKAIAEHPSLILLDIIMPVMDGYEVCRRIKENPVTREIPVIFVTSMDEENDEAKGLELGAIDYITKPFSIPIVKIRVKNQLELKRHRDLLERLSSLDGLTGIPNRRQFDFFLEHEWQNAIRTQLPISLIMMDIDFFKAFNDNYGHLSGDDCLKKVAKALENTNRRSTDLVARYGGEEFACVLPRTDLGGALLVANRFKEVVESLSIKHAFSSVVDHITLSIGVNSVVPEYGATSAEFIKNVDALLYTAKRNGRNRVHHI
ncbi:MAG: diguanylate cyclase [Clostridia bacterium]|nr:diguanylate cyclase [Clostridia bacterium]